MSYISSLNILGDDSSIPLSEEDVTNELALWANAQFKFDSTPGTALLDDPLKQAVNTNNIYAVFNSIQHYEQQHHHVHGSLIENMIATPNDNNASLLSMMQETSSQHFHSDNDNMVDDMMTPTTDLYSSVPSTPNTPTSSGHLLTSASLPPHSATSMTDTSCNVTVPANIKDDSSTTLKSDVAHDKSKPNADEDKRRRNTAASARFRMKKKLREQALQQTVKEMTTKTEHLEKRCKELEMEAKWLRALLVEKNPALVTPLPGVMISNDENTSLTANSSCFSSSG